MSKLITYGELRVYIEAPEQQKEEALALSAIISRVSNDAENEAAVEAQLALRGYLKTVEDSRVAIKAPFLELTRKINATAREETSDIAKELLRLDGIVGNYAQLKIAKLKSEESARKQSLTDIERAREEELAKADTHEEREAIQERYCSLTAAIPVPKLETAKGQQIKPDFDIEVTNPELLARCHYPELCDVKPKMGAIKDALKAGRTVQGIKATPKIRAGVRLPPASKQQLIEA